MTPASPQSRVQAVEHALLLTLGQVAIIIAATRVTGNLARPIGQQRAVGESSQASCSDPRRSARSRRTPSNRFFPSPSKPGIFAIFGGFVMGAVFHDRRDLTLEGRKSCRSSLHSAHSGMRTPYGSMEVSCSGGFSSFLPPGGLRTRPGAPPQVRRGCFRSAPCPSPETSRFQSPVRR
jgi:hypothetical protein